VRGFLYGVLFSDSDGARAGAGEIGLRDVAGAGGRGPGVERGGKSRAAIPHYRRGVGRPPWRG